MEHRPGTRADGAPDHTWFPAWFFAAGRGVGFALLSGAALVVFAAVVLLPERARLARVRYELGCEQARTADQEAMVAAQERVIADLLTDPVLIKRVAMSQCDMWPENAAVAVESGRRPSLPPHAVRPFRHARPEPPSRWLLGAEARLRNPPVRRGLLLMAAGLLSVAIFLFAAPGRYHQEGEKPHRTPHSPNGK